MKKEESVVVAPVVPKPVGPPVHTHELGTIPESGECALCESHGNPVATHEDDFEIASDDDVQTRLSNILGQEDYDEEEE
jgi:hypothetical protein